MPPGIRHWRGKFRLATRPEFGVSEIPGDPPWHHRAAGGWGPVNWGLPCVAGAPDGPVGDLGRCPAKFAHLEGEIECSERPMRR